MNKIAAINCRRRQYQFIKSKDLQQRQESAAKLIDAYAQLKQLDDKSEMLSCYSDTTKELQQALINKQLMDMFGNQM